MSKKKRSVGGLDVSHCRGEYAALVKVPEMDRVLVLRGFDQAAFSQETALERIKVMARLNVEKLRVQKGDFRPASDSDFIVDSFSYQGKQVFLS